MPWLDLLTRLALDADPDNPDSWIWTDITSRVRATDPVTHQITRAYRDQATDADKATCRLTLDMIDGLLAPRNPTGAWFGRIKPFGTPLQVALRRVRDTFNRTSASGWASADSGQPYTVFGFGGSILNAHAFVSAGTGKHSVPQANAHRSTWLSTVSLADTIVSGVVSITGTSGATGGTLEPGGILTRMQGINDYYMCRCEIAPGGAVTARIAYVKGGVQTSVTSTVVSGLTWTGQPLRVMVMTLGQTVWYKVWIAAAAEPAGWTIKADIPAAGQIRRGGIGFRSGVGTGNTNPLPVQFEWSPDIAVLVPRFTGSIDELPPRWDKTGKNRYAPIVASGVTQRLLGAGQIQSAIVRTVLSSDNPHPFGFYPCEDGDGSTSIAPGVPGIEPMRIYGDPGVIDWSSYSDIEGSAPLPRLTDGVRLVARMPQYTATGKLGFRCAINTPALYASARRVVELRFSSGTIRRWVVQFDNGGSITPLAYDINGTELLGAPPGLFGSAYNGVRAWMEIDLTQNGGNIDWAFRFGDAAFGLAEEPGSEPGTLGQLDRVTVAPDADLTDTVIGQIVLTNDLGVAKFSAINGAWVGWRGETAAHRVAGMAHDAALPVYVEPHDESLSTVVGPQPVASSVLSNLRDSVQVDGGLLYDSASIPGMRMVPIGARYNRPMDLALDATDLKDAPEPTDDSQHLVNEVVASRPGGGSRTARDDASQASIGVYGPKPITRNVNTDDQLAYQAQWEVGLGTVDAARVPSLSLDLRANESLIDSWLCCEPGARVTVANPPAGLPPDPLDEHMIGYTESLGPFKFDVDMVTVPASPYDAFTLDSTVDNLGRLDTEDSVLPQGATSGATSLLVASRDGSTWASGTYDVGAAGERMTVTAVAPALTDAFTRSVSGGWGTAPNGTPWVALVGAAEHSVTGAVGRQVHSAVNAEHRVSIDTGSRDVELLVDILVPLGSAAGAPVTWDVWMAAASAADNYRAFVQLGTDGNMSVGLAKAVGGVFTSITSQLVVPGHTGGATWRLRAAVYGQELRAKIWRTSGSEPTGWHRGATVPIGEIPQGTLVELRSRFEAGNTNTLPQNIDWDNFTLVNPQTVTVTRAVNGVAKAQAAGTPISLWRPPHLAL